MTPLHLEILMHHYVSPTPFRATGEVIAQYTQNLIDMGLLRCETHCILTTDKGKAWFERVLNTPMPTQKWVWSEDDT